MWGSPVLLLTLMTVSVFGAEFVRNEKQLNLKSKLQDQSWIQGRSTLVAAGDNSTCNAIFSCSNCNTARICKPTTTGAFEEVTTIPCPAAQPFCDYGTGTCTTVPDASCGQTDPFICLQDGHFPDATNCTAYHVCDNLVSHKFGCSITGDNYNPLTQQCEAGALCATFTCDKSGRKVAAEHNPSVLSVPYQTYYAYCDKNTGAPIVIDKCPGAYQLNSTSQVCEAVCEKEGVQADLNDCTSYYKCSPFWIPGQDPILIKQQLPCPTNTGFDPSQFICVDLKEYPSCKTSVQKRASLIERLNSIKLNP